MKTELEKKLNKLPAFIPILDDQYIIRIFAINLIFIVMNRYDWNKEKLEEAIANSFNYCDVLRYLGIPLQGNNSCTLKSKIKDMYNI